VPDIPEKAVQAATEALARRDFADRTFEGYARAMLKALADAGLVIIPAETVFHAAACIEAAARDWKGSAPTDVDLVAKLRAALPEGTDHA
jgi:hypothetical protein